MVNAQAIQTLAGNTMNFPSDDNEPILLNGRPITHIGDEKDRSFVANPNQSVGDIPSSGRAGATAQPSKEQRLREMENEYAVTSTDAIKQEEDAKGHTAAQAAAKEDAPKAKAPARRASAVKPIGFSDISTFNTATIQQTESNARSKDGAAYQEFLRNPHGNK